MKPSRTIFLARAALLCVLAAACAPAVSSPAKSGSGPIPTASSPTATDCPTPESGPGAKVAICAPGEVETPVSTISALAAVPAGPTAPRGAAVTSAPAHPQAQPSPTPCTEDTCVVSPAFPFAFPILPPGNDQFDPTYRFSSTPGRWRSPHRGLDVQNAEGVPVHAAAEGKVVVAGDDSTTAYGPTPDFYGNLVVLEHRLPGFPQPLFTLYGHLSRVLVSVGEGVITGQEIGEVGMSGVAMGTHLHIEVRLGENTYDHTLNPELWLKPTQSPSGQPGGGLAGRITGQPPAGQEVVIEHLQAQDGPVTSRSYVKVYLEPEVTGRPPYEESFGIGNLEPGWYRVSFAQNGIQSQTVQVFPGQLTVMTFRPFGP